MKNFMLLAGMLFSTVLTAAVPEFLVTGEKPVRLETMAEKELCLFYQKIYGKELKKITEKEADGKSVIFLGNTEFARKNGVDPDSAGKEEWILKTVGDDLIISGGRPVGTLYGVYELLERLGTAFLTPDETVVPTGKPDFPKFDEKKKPAFAFGHGLSYTTFAVSNLRIDKREVAADGKWHEVQDGLWQFGGEGRGGANYGGALGTTRPTWRW